MSAVSLDGDVFGVILSHIHDVSVLDSILENCTLPGPSRQLVIARRLQFPVSVTSSYPTHTSALFNLLVSLPHLAACIQHVDVTSGPSQYTLQSLPSIPQEFDYDETENIDLGSIFFVEDPRMHYLGRQAIAARKLYPALPTLFAFMQSLTTLTWRGSPWPGKQFFAVLSSLPNFRGLAVDCAQDDRGDPRALWDADTWENITEFFESSVASQIRDLKLLRITEDIYRILQMHLPSLTSCETFYLDLNCGLWSFDTTFGTPPGCPGENYDFHPFQFHSHSPLHTFTLITADLTLNVPTGGSLRLIEGFRQLKKLQILIQQGFPWRVIRAVRSFNAIDIAEGLSNLSHLIVTEADNHLPSGARYFPGFHQFISHLPRLSKLWVYRVVLLPLHGEDSQWDEWDPSPGQPLRTLSEFWESVEWTVIQPVLTQLCELRVGLGALDEVSLNQVLDACSIELLEKLGFEWDWGPPIFNNGKTQGNESKSSEFDAIDDGLPQFDVNQPLDLGGARFKQFSDTLLLRLGQFKHLKDLHVTVPEPCDPKDNWQHCLDLVQRIFSACPQVVRVGIGRNCVWERSGVTGGVSLVEENLEGFYNVGRSNRGEPTIEQPVRRKRAPDLREGREEVGEDKGLIGLLQQEAKRRVGVN